MQFERLTVATYNRCWNSRAYERRQILYPGRLDAFIPEIDFGLAAVVGQVNVHGEQNFSSEEASVGRVVRRAQLLFGEGWDHGGAIVEGIA
jgi:hypothetical protein